MSVDVMDPVSPPVPAPIPVETTETPRAPQTAAEWNAVGVALRANGKLKEAVACYGKRSQPARSTPASGRTSAMRLPNSSSTRGRLPRIARR